MAVKTIQTILNEIAATLPDNTTGLITPAALRAALNDMCESLFTRSATMYGSLGAGVAQSITTTPTNYPVLMPAAINSNPALFTVNSVAGTITAARGGFGYTLNANMVWQAGSINTELDATVFRNGVAYNRARVEQTGPTQNRPYSASFSVVIAGVTDGEVFEVRLSSPQGPISITFFSMDFTVALNPTLTAI